MIKPEVELYCLRNPEVAKSVGKKIFLGERDTDKLLKGVPDKDKEKVQGILKWAADNNSAYVKKVFAEIYRAIK